MGNKKLCEPYLNRLSPHLLKQLCGCLRDMEESLAGLDAPQKVRLLYSCIALESKYDYTYKKSLSYSFLGALKNGYACCAGFADLLCLLVNWFCEEEKCVIRRVDGYIIRPDVPAERNPWHNGHAWNIITFDDTTWFHLDVTWDLGKDLDHFRWFLVSDQEMTTRLPDSEIPKCPYRCILRATPEYEEILLRLREIWRTIPQMLS